MIEVKLRSFGHTEGGVHAEPVIFFERLHIHNIRQHQEYLVQLLHQLDNDRAKQSDEEYSGHGKASEANTSPPGSLDRDMLCGALRSYCQALDDYDSMKSLPKYLDTETLEKTVKQEEALRTNQPEGPSRVVGLEGSATEWYFATRRMPSRHPFNEAFRLFLPIIIDAFVQFSFAVIFALLLITPMLIMVYIRGRTASVATTCISVVLFALLLVSWSTFDKFIELAETIQIRHKAWWEKHKWFLLVPLIGKFRKFGLRLSRFEPKDILGATAAYAAVLVVFVGISISYS